MGIDFLDMNFRLEKRFGFRLDWMDAINAAVAEKRKFDPTAGEVCAAVEAGLKARGLTQRRDARSDATEGKPPVLEYASGDDRDWFDGRQDVWEAVREVIAATIQCGVENVQRESRLFADLGMT